MIRRWKIQQSTAVLQGKAKEFSKIFGIYCILYTVYYIQALKNAVLTLKRVENIHWRNKAQIDVKLQLECCVISKLISNPSYYNGSDAMDLYNIFHVYFVSEPIILVYLLPFKDIKVSFIQNKNI